MTKVNNNAVSAELQGYLDGLLADVIGEAKALGIPVSGRIIPKVSVNRRPKKRFGCCKRRPAEPGDASYFLQDPGKRTSGFESLPGSSEKRKKGLGLLPGSIVYSIELSAFMMKADEHSIKNVLAHEVLHSCEGCSNHGAIWKKYAALMNSAYGYSISATSSYEGYGLEHPSENLQLNYKIVCRKCGSTFYRQRKSRVVTHASSYRCARCGGKLDAYQIIRKKADS